MCLWVFLPPVVLGPIWSGLCLPQTHLFSTYLHAVSRKESFDLILSIYLLPGPLTFSFFHLDCDLSKICIWLSYFSDVSWNAISSKRPSLTTIKFFPSFHYFLYHNAINFLLWGIILCQIDLFHCIFIICLFPGRWSPNGSGLKVLLTIGFQYQGEGLEQSR